ncbi:N-alpha-acetyltransferase, non-catalitic subunit [Coemansia sp. RSA 1813]|nr:N-alpha-acetyltransferase, non-catalitic subunit [Coemansia sp. RSA 1843]KAJ2090767.1 N-alpha-acetyltransferase, non-catalitic subunit [Coemansia sp. RSA 986]KAJ2216015.1 N-alpha-acetyltransferase, non-catalitic subunit [Coemansia sp. RSA 487]KAJ2570429.1 N-alpha-acetyltransferase, non-catalitic subunit [Coemansia sp. RSA 1813]
MADKVIVDKDGTEWLDITKELELGAKQLKVGELLKPDSFTLFEAMVAVQVMDPRLDMGMLTAEAQAEIALWDMNRKLTLTDVLWIMDQMFCCEMTLHHSASLLQTIYTCNYFTADDQMPRETIGRRDLDGGNPARDLVLYPMLIAVGACCARVWREYQNDNLYPDEDVHSGVLAQRFFDEYALNEVYVLLDCAHAYLQDIAEYKTKWVDDVQIRAAKVLIEQLEMRRCWLLVLVDLSAETISDDPGALRRGVDQLRRLTELHHQQQQELNRKNNSNNATASLGTPVGGVFDRKCMRKYPTLTPVRPRELMTHGEAHDAFGHILADIALVEELLSIESVEHLVHFFLRFSRRTPTPVPFVRSLVMSVFVTNGRVQLAQQSVAAFARRAINELGGGGSYVWDTLEGSVESRQRASAFCNDAGGLLVCWLKSLCQNPPRQRRIALKSLGSWDALQADGEQLDITAFALANPKMPAEAAGDPETNAFALSSWAYHMKLLIMEAGLLAGVRLEVYLDYEFAQVFCYAAQIFEAHQAHMERVARMVAAARRVKQQQPRTQAVPWTMRAVDDDECMAQIERWHVLAGAQKDLATSQWLVSHACERLGVFRAPWARRTTRLALEISSQQQQQETHDAQRARFALRFRAFVQLGSPAPPTFAGWLATSAQLDTHALGELFLHAGNVVGDAKSALERSRRAASSTGDGVSSSQALAGWDACFRPLYFVVLANSVALAKLRKRSPALAQMPQPLRVTGDQAMAYQKHAVDAALARQQQSNGNGVGNGQQQQQQPRAKSDKKRRKAARQDQAHMAAAQRWLDGVTRMAQSDVKIAWSCAPDKNPDWPIFSFQ